MRIALVLALVVACGKDKVAPSPGSGAGMAADPSGSAASAPTRATAAPPADDAQRARAAALIGELKRSLVGAVTAAMDQGAPAAIEACHTMAPALTAALARDGAVIGRATRKPRNPANQATGWRSEALAEFEALHADKALLAGKSFARQLDDGRLAYAEPLVIQELCVTCHGTAIGPEVTAAIAAKYPNDQATGYAVGDLRGIAWVELPAK